MATYRPLIGSAAHRVCLALATLPGSTLSEDAIAMDHGKPTSWVSAILAEAVSTGWLIRRRGDDRRMVYAAGPLLTLKALEEGSDKPEPADLPASSVFPPAPSKSFSQSPAEQAGNVKPAASPTATPKKRSRFAEGKVDFGSIKMRQDTPPPRLGRPGSQGQWAPLLDSMEIGDWLSLPRINHPGAMKAVSVHNKRHKSQQATPFAPARLWVTYLTETESVVVCKALADAKKA